MRRGARWRVTVQEYGRRFDVETSVVDMALDQLCFAKTGAALCRSLSRMRRELIALMIVRPAGPERSDGLAFGRTLLAF